MRTLVISLPLERVSANTEFDYVWTDDGVRVAGAGRARAQALPGLLQAGDQRVALAPARALSWHKVSFPAGVSVGSARWRAVLEGLLEDQLLDAPERLHFALPQPLQAGQPQWVASCERRWLAMAVQGLAVAGQTLGRVLPEWGPPAGPWRMHVSGPAQAPQAVVCSDEGVSLVPWDEDALAWLLDPVDGATDRLAGLSAEPDMALLISQRLGRPVQAIKRHERWLQAASPAWDLARGLQMRKRLQRGRLAWLQAPRWRLARWAAVLLAGVNLLGLNAWAWMEQRQLQAAQARLEGLFTSTFAQQPLILSAPVQMAREVRRLELASAAAATADLDVMLGVLSRALPSGRSAQALDYAAGQLQLKGLDMDNADMAALTASLRAQGYSLSAEGATLRMQPLALPPLATRVRP